MKRNEAIGRWKVARQRGEKTAADYGFTSLPIDPFIIAERAGIVVQAKPDTVGGTSGMLLRHGNDYGIMYATHLKNEGFERFSIAHELGHYFLNGHMDHVLPPGADFHESCAGFASGEPYEIEADHFATGLLMPGRLFGRAIGRVKDGLEGVEAMAALCKTSLTATAIRYAERTNCAAAIVVSTGAHIDYCFLSETLRDAKNVEWLKRGTSLPSESLTVDFNQDTAKVAGGKRIRGKTDLADWVGGHSAEGMEEVVGLGGYGKTLTVISCPDYPEEEDIEEEGWLEESRTPRFHKK